MYYQKLVYTIMFLYVLYFFITVVGAYDSKFFNLTDLNFRFDSEDNFHFKASSSSNLMESLPCNGLQNTKRAPYVVIILYKTSGKFMGMGVIINSRTVLTSKGAVLLARESPSAVTVLAGFRSPWWGENSQVRRAGQMLFNDHELVLIEVEAEWVFNNRIKPIEVNAISDPIGDNYYKAFLIFGMQTTAEFNAGDSLSKSQYYTGELHTINTKNDCKSDYKNMEPEFTDMDHQCFFPNATFCEGCIGSPVVGGRFRKKEPELVGVVVKSSCLLKTRQIVAVKLANLSRWVKTHAFYGKVKDITEK